MKLLSRILDRIFFIIGAILYILEAGAEYWFALILIALGIWFTVGLKDFTTKENMQAVVYCKNGNEVECTAAIDKAVYWDNFEKANYLRKTYEDSTGRKIK